MESYLTDKENEEIDNLFKNDNFLNFYSSNLTADSDTFEDEDTPDILFKRAKKSIEAFANYNPKWW